MSDNATAADLGDESAAPTLVNKLSAEALGTFVLVFFGCGSVVLALHGGVGVNIAAVGLTFGLAVTIMAYAVGRISGGHFNPAVTLGAVLSGRLAWRETPIYFAAQAAGALVATVLLLVVASMSPRRACTSSVSMAWRRASAARCYRLALDELSSQHERLSTLPAEELSAAIEALGPSPLAAERLPGAALRGELAASQLGRRLTLEIWWDEPNRDAAPVRLTAWLATGQASGVFGGEEPVHFAMPLSAKDSRPLPLAPDGDARNEEARP